MSVVLDKATALRNEISGSTTNKIVCKASSREVAGPKKKHVDFLIQLTNDPHCSIPTLADLINDRVRGSSWVIVMKGLVLAHNLMTLGNEKYLQCLATKTNNFPVETFSDRSDTLSSDMSIYVRKYARYLGYTCVAYRTLAMDACRAEKGDASPFRTMEPAKLLKAIGIVQQQLDYLLEVELTAGELTNGVINTAFLMLYKDLIKLYTVYNDAIINLLEKFFEMKKAQCKEAVEIYRKFLTRQEGVQKFLQLAEDVGVDRQAHLNLRQVPGDLLPALETHVAEMDSVRKTGAAPSPVIKAASDKLSKLRDQSSVREPSPPTPPTSPGQEGLPSASSDILEAQRKRFEELQRQSKTTKPSPVKTTPTSSAAATTPAIKATPTSNAGPSDDFLGLDGSFTSLPPRQNPWGNPTSSSAATSSSYNPFLSTASPAASFVVSQQQPSTLPASGGTAIDPWQSQRSGYQEVDLFSEIRGGQPDFDAVFGGHGSRPLPPTSSSAARLHGGSLGDMLQPTAVGAHASTQVDQPRRQLQGSRLTTDVESSLAKTAESLSVDMVGTTKTGMPKKTEHQWKPASDPVKTGGPNWHHQQIQPTTLPPGQPVPSAATGLTKGGVSADWKGGMYAGYFPTQPQQRAMMPPAQQPYMMRPGAPTMYSGPMMWPNQRQPFPQQQDPFGSIGTHPASLF